MIKRVPLVKRTPTQALELRVERLRAFLSEIARLARLPHTPIEALAWKVNDALVGDDLLKPSPRKAMTAKRKGEQ